MTKKDIQDSATKELHNEFIKEFPDPNDRASFDSFGSVYVHWLEAELIKARSNKR